MARLAFTCYVAKVGLDEVPTLLLPPPEHWNIVLSLPLWFTLCWGSSTELSEC